MTPAEKARRVLAGGKPPVEATSIRLANGTLTIELVDDEGRSAVRLATKYYYGGNSETITVPSYGARLIARCIERITTSRTEHGSPYEVNGVEVRRASGGSLQIGAVLLPSTESDLVVAALREYAGEADRDNASLAQQSRDASA